MGTGAVTIVPVASTAELDRFIRLPQALYAADPSFVPQLVMERREALSPKKNPLFQHATAQFWLAVRDGRDVGRISAQDDTLVAGGVGQFGMIAAIDDAAVFAALFAAAEAWLRGRGKTKAQGPFNLSINEETGLLIDGFGTPPMIFMAHDPAYAAARVEALGYAKAMDLIAYLYDIESEFPASARRMLDRRRPEGLVVRNLDMTRYEAEMKTITSIFNDAWSGNWGFVPFTEAEVVHMAKSLKLLIDPQWCAIVELRGEPVGFGITVPNLNEWIADFGGRLLPFNWARLLWRMKRGAKTARVPLMGIRRSFAGGLVGGLAPFLIVDRMRAGVRKDGVSHVELSWILESNKAMRAIIKAVGGVPYKTYRVYEKALGAGVPPLAEAASPLPP